MALCLAAAKLGKGNPKAAKRILRNITVPENSPALFNYYYCLGESNRQLKNRTEAVKYFRKAISIAPNPGIKQSSPGSSIPWNNPDKKKAEKFVELFRRIYQVES